jgi:hypothetical protein
MKHSAILDSAQRAVRSMVCTQCYQRPHGSEALDAATPRPCEPACTIFRNLDRLALAVFTGRSAGQFSDDVMRQHVCPECNGSPTAGDFCSERLARTCPLSRYSTQVVTILEQLRDHRAAEAASGF